MLVAMVPFLTMAQKRSKKGKNVKIEKIVKPDKISYSNAPYEFMVIVGNELTSANKDNINSKVIVSFDFGGVKSIDAKSFNKMSKIYRTMAEAVNGAASLGWDFVSSDVILSGKDKIHYYYMRKNK